LSQLTTDAQTELEIELSRGDEGDRDSLAAMPGARNFR